MRHKYIGLLWTALIILLASASSSAHHGSASFDNEKVLNFKGTVTEWLWANPHCFLRVDVKDETGAVKNWNLELGNPTDIASRGFRRTLFKVGDPVTVSVTPVKNGAPVGRLRTVTLPDGTVL